MPSFRPGGMIRALTLVGAMALLGGCVFVPVGPPVVAEPAVVVPGPVIIAPGRAYHGHRGYYGGYRRGYGRHW